MAAFLRIPTESWPRARTCVAALALGIGVAGSAVAAEPGTDERGSGSVAQSCEVELTLAHRKDVSRVVELATSLGGRRVEHQAERYIVDLPVSQKQTLVPRLRELGQTRVWPCVVTNVSQELASAQADVASARAQVSRLQGIADKPGPTADKLSAEEELHEARMSMELAVQRLAALERRTESVRFAIGFALPPGTTLDKPRLPMPWLRQLGLELLQEPRSFAPPTPGSDGFFDLEARLGGTYFRDPQAFGDTPGLGSGTLAVRGLAEADPVGFYASLELTLGGGGGFAYAAQFLGGVGVPLGTRVAVTLGTGPGIDGVTGGVVRAGVPLPIELGTHFDLGFMDAALWSRHGWVAWSEARADGSKRALFGDELSTGLTLGFGERQERGGSNRRLGYRVGVAYRELLGSATYELRLGWGEHQTSLR